MRYKKPNLFCYRVAQAVCFPVAKLVFQRKIIRNEIKGKKGPFVVICNHQCALDFVNLIGMTARPMSFVISKSILNSLPIRDFVKKMGVIPKQQFQTTVADMKNMKAVIDAGGPLVIYPAGLMCEDGLSTPIPAATYKFLKWLGADIYVAKVSGTYFTMPKWGKGLRPGKTFLDVYHLFSKEELKNTDVKTLREKAENALLFDAYREQEENRVAYRGNRNIAGLENVLYQCPACKEEFSMQIKNGNTLFCTHCGFAQQSDEFGFFHKLEGPGEEMRYVSDWSRWIYRHMQEKISSGQLDSIRVKTDIYMPKTDKPGFRRAGTGVLELRKGLCLLEGNVDGGEITLENETISFPSLPFSPGKYLEIQHGKDIYRCVLEDGKQVMKLINMIKIFNELGMTAISG